MKPYGWNGFDSVRWGRLGSVMQSHEIHQKRNVNCVSNSVRACRKRHRRIYKKAHRSMVKKQIRHWHEEYSVKHPDILLMKLFDLHK